MKLLLFISGELLVNYMLQSVPFALSSIINSVVPEGEGGSGKCWVQIYPIQDPGFGTYWFNCAKRFVIAIIFTRGEKNIAIIPAHNKEKVTKQVGCTNGKE